jgi:archaellum biogenesis protein FlaJ (TadC family)
MIKVMSAAALSCLIFVLTLGGIFLGALLHRALPKDHLNKESQDVVRLGVGLIATLAALLLGLLIAAAKSTFDTQSTQVTQITADLILLDDLLAQYGPDVSSYLRNRAR